MRGHSGYTLLAPTDPARQELLFEGPYEGRLVTWHATFVTRKRYNDMLVAKGAPPLRQNMIEIDGLSAAEMRLLVVIDIDQFDTPAMLKTLVMVRQYKGLRVGRHYFGGNNNDETSVSAELG